MTDAPFSVQTRGGRSRLWLALLAAGVLLVGCAQTTAPSTVADSTAQARNEHFANLYVQVLPVDQIFDTALKSDPNWPLHKKVAQAKVTAREVACVREQLSPENIRNIQRQRALRYAALYPERIAADSRLLEGPLGKLYANVFVYVMQTLEGSLGAGKRPATAIQPETVEGMRQHILQMYPGMKVQDTLDMMMFSQDPGAQPLRDLMYFSHRDFQSKAKQMLSVPMLAALAQCDININQL